MRKLYDAPAIFLLLFGQNAICASGDGIDATGDWQWGDGEL